jgi:hypothetical protein
MRNFFYNKYKSFKIKYFYPWQVRTKPKIFCIGLNKTGTTSISKAFEDLGFIIGNQRKAEKLLRQIINKDYYELLKFCKSAQVFQDVPFSFFNVYKILHQNFPNAQFILTVRDSPEQWVNSITKFHSQKFSNNKIATADELKNANYVWKGWIWEAMHFNFNISEEDPYNKEFLMGKYNTFNAEVSEYFKNSANFLKINLSDEAAYQTFTNFINVKSPYTDFPWENKTSAINK